MSSKKSARSTKSTKPEKKDTSKKETSKKESPKKETTKKVQKQDPKLIEVDFCNALKISRDILVAGTKLDATISKISDLTASGYKFHCKKGSPERTVKYIKTFYDENQRSITTNSIFEDDEEHTILCIGSGDARKVQLNITLTHKMGIIVKEAFTLPKENKSTPKSEFVWIDNFKVLIYKIFLAVAPEEDKKVVKELLDVYEAGSTARPKSTLRTLAKEFGLKGSTVDSAMDTLSTEGPGGMIKKLGGSKMISQVAQFATSMGISGMPKMPEGDEDALEPEDDEKLEEEIAEDDKKIKGKIEEADT